MPRTALRWRPSESPARKASSRLGPMMPFVLARASVWQEPHLATNACLPMITLGLLALLTEHPLAPRASASSAAAPARRRRRRDDRPPASSPPESPPTAVNGRLKLMSGAEHYPKRRVPRVVHQFGDAPPCLDGSSGPLAGLLRP